MNFDTLITIIAGLAMFLILVTIHEGGHFSGAKLSGIKVNEFSVGMGPSLFNKKKGETLYSLRALPIGGYVMMEGEEENSSDPRSFNNSSAWKRLITIFAGPFVNYLFAFIVFFIIACFQGHTTTIVEQVELNSPAFEAGITQGDEIIKINGKNISIFQEISEIINASDDDINIILSRNGNDVSINLNPKIEDGRKIIGITPKITNSFLSNIKYAFDYTIFMTVIIWNSLKGLFTGLFGLNQLSGPVGVISQVGESLNYGFLTYLNFSALISINLGFFNLLPIPALDGSKILFILIEMIMGRPINKKFEQNITMIGFIFLLGLILYATFNDILRVF